MPALERSCERHQIGSRPTAVQVWAGLSTCDRCSQCRDPPLILDHALLTDRPRSAAQPRHTVEQLSEHRHVGDDSDATSLWACRRRSKPSWLTLLLVDIDTIKRLEQEFFKVAKRFAERRNIAYGAWRDACVPPKFLSGLEYSGLGGNDLRTGDVVASASP
jgi:hypothetical protein